MPEFDLETALENVGGEPALLVEVIETCIGGYSEHLEEIRTAVKAGDLRAMERGAHKLKGTLLLLAAHAASDSAQTLENMGREGHLPDAVETMNRLEQEVQRLVNSLRSFLTSA